MRTFFIAKKMYTSQPSFGFWKIVRNTFIFAVTSLFLAGCSTVQQSQTGLSEQNVPTTPANPILAFVKKAQAAGEISIVQMSEEAAPVRVRAERIYHSASGYQCRRYYLSNPQGITAFSAHLACNIDGQWSEVKQLLNTDLYNNS